MCCCKSPFPLFPTQNVNGHLVQGTTGHFKAFMRHQSRDSEDSTNISLNGSSLRLIRLPKHLTITVGIKAFSAGWRRSHLLPPAGAHPEVRLREKKKQKHKFSQIFTRGISSRLLLSFALFTECLRQRCMIATDILHSCRTLPSFPWCDLGAMRCSNTG